MSRINQNIEELLNAFLDGELMHTEQMQVQRMVAEDGQVAQRLRELQECKTIIQRMPVTESPADMTKRVMAALEGTALISHRTDGLSEPEKQKSRPRKVLILTATIVTAAILTAAVYSVLTSDYNPQPTTGNQPFVALETGKGFQGRLNLTTGEPAAVSAFINSAITENGFSDTLTVSSRPNAKIYTFNCSRNELDSLLADLAVIWQRCDSRTLSVSTDNFGNNVVVNAVTVEQIANIANQDTQTNAIQVAKDVALLNNSMAELVPSSAVAFNDRNVDLTDQWRIPMPLLTGRRDQQNMPKEQPPQARQISLTIVVTGQ